MIKWQKTSKNHLSSRSFVCFFLFESEKEAEDKLLHRAELTISLIDQRQQRAATDVSLFAKDQVGTEGCLLRDAADLVRHLCAISPELLGITPTGDGSAATVSVADTAQKMESGDPIPQSSHGGERENDEQERPGEVTRGGRRIGRNRGKAGTLAGGSRCGLCG